MEASSVVVRNANHLVYRKGGPKEAVEFYNCSVPYERVLHEEAEQSKADQEVYATLKNVMEDYDPHYQSDLSEASVLAWQENYQLWLDQRNGVGKKPNFVIIYTDDQGYQDLGCFGSPNIKTPHIDQMATEGMRFTDFYSAASVCTPSRAALLTGCYPARVGKLPVLFPNRGGQGLNPDETTIAKMLKGKGYATACIGKWHLGHQVEFLPTSHGFDSYYGIPYSNDMGTDKNMALAEDIIWRNDIDEEKLRNGKAGGPPLMRGTEVIEVPVDQNTLTKRYTQEAIKFIEGNKDTPFFLYLPHTMPHIPLYASPEFEGKSEAGLYGDCIEEIDWSVGQITHTLKKLGIDKNTLIVYSSDNGPWNLKGNATDKVKGNMNRKTGGSAHPLKGHKFSYHEGGVRVPTVMWWPGRIPAGTTCSEIAGTIDLLPTFATLSGTKLPNKKIDGKNIAPLLKGAKNAKTPHEAWFYQTNGIRSGKWKFIGGNLYDLSQDISESTNVAKDHPEVVERLKAVLKEHADEIKANARPPGQIDTPVTRIPQKPIDWSQVKVGDVFASSQVPNVVKKAIQISGMIETAADAEHIVVAHGGTTVGYSLYQKGGNLVFSVSADKDHRERVHMPIRTGKLRFKAGLNDKGHLFLQVGDEEPVRSPSGNHWIRKVPQENLSIGFDEAHPVDPEAPKAKFRGKLIELQVE
jgi:arylsulfatase A-like enzyme